MKLKSISKILPFIPLLLAIICVFFLIFHSDKYNRPIENKRPDYLSSLIPYTIGNLKSTDIPLGNTQDVIKATEKILATSDFLNRRYTFADGKIFTLYISYWLPNTMDVIRASIHTPDRCWVENGWTSNPEKRGSDLILEIKGKKTFPANYGQYSYKIEQKTSSENVWFWFIVDGKIYNYGTKDIYLASPIKWLENVIVDSVKGSPEQYFIRINSSEKLEDFLKDKDFIELMSKLGDMILFENKNK